eukprot:6193141-Pleurochrysis_carterae.AAC.1
MVPLSPRLRAPRPPPPAAAATPSLPSLASLASFAPSVSLALHSASPSAAPDRDLDAQLPIFALSLRSSQSNNAA